MSWLVLAPPALASIALLFAPGLAIGLLFGLRRLWLFALAPLLSTAVIAAATLVLPTIGLRWNPLTVGLFALVVIAIAAVLARFVAAARLHDSEPPLHGAPPAHLRALVWLIPAALMTVLFCIGIGAPDAISQTYDNTFHLTGVAFIINQGDASPLHLVGLINAGDTGFYPNVWHAAAALVTQLSGASLPVAINAFTLVSIAAIWPLGLQLLTRQLVRYTAPAMLTAGVFAASFPAFPLYPLSYGVLYPFVFGTLLAPVVLTLMLQATGLTRERRIAHPFMVWACTGVGLATIALAHPSALASVLTLSAPIAGIAYLAGWRTRSPKQRALRTLWLALYLVIGWQVFISLRTDTVWPAQNRAIPTVLQALSGSLLGIGLPLTVGALALAGTVIAIWRWERHALTAAALWATGIGFYIVAAGLRFDSLRFFVGAWYADAPRLAALAVLALVPICAFAVDHLAWVLRVRLRRVGKPLAIGGVALVLAITPLTSGFESFLPVMRVTYDPASTDTFAALSDAQQGLLTNVTADGEQLVMSNLLSTDELALIKRLPGEVPPDAVVIGSPWTGTSMIYALADRTPALMHLNSRTDDDIWLIRETFALEPDSPRMCAALERSGVRYVLDFGTQEVLGLRHHYAGIEGLEHSPAVRLVDQQGDARLYQITSCGLG